MEEGFFDRPGAAVSACDVWDGIDIEALVALERIGSLRYRSRYGDGNLNGRSYGGQVLGQAMMAASLSAPDVRPVSTFQLLFLRGADFPTSGSTSKSKFSRRASGSRLAISPAFKATDAWCWMRTRRFARRNWRPGMLYPRSLEKRNPITCRS
jgi:hypothetical protein